MIDSMAADAAQANGFEWGPIITLMLGIFMTTGIGLFTWSIRRVIARIDWLGEKMESVGTRLTVVETTQTLTAATASATAANVRTTARKVGVMPKDIEQTLQSAPRAATQ